MNRPFSCHPFLHAGVALLLSLAGLGTREACAINASPHPVEVTQADGTVVRLRIHGDDVFHWFEDEAGYTVVRRGRDYLYGQLDGAGKLVAGNLMVGKGSPVSLGISKRLLPAPAQREKRKAGPAPVNGEGAAAAPPAPPLLVPPAGTVKNLVVLCRFSNHTLGVHTRAEADYDTIFNTVGGDATLAPTGSVKDYYTENSYGAMTLQSTVTVWVTLPQTEAYYANGFDGTGSYPQNAQRMVEDALALVDASVNFGQFDQDNDGFIDAISVIHSGYGAETGGGGGNWIWSHRWGLPANWVSADNNSLGVKVKVRDYHTEPALWGTSGTAPVRIGVICHETGHFFGLPDFYDTDGTSEGIGSWCLMANSWGFDGTQLRPPHFSAWCKIQLGWVTPTVIGPGAQSAPRVETSPTVFKITTGFPSGEYLLVENRQPFGFESAMSQGGLAIWHIDETKTNNNSEGYPGQVGWPGNANHYKVALLQADGLYEMEKGINRGDGGDVYRSGGVSEINSTTVPNTKTYQGGTVVSTGNVISGISVSGATMTFNLSYDTSIPEINVTGNAVTIADGDTTPTTADFTDFGSTSVAGGTVVRTFTVQNTGTGPLSLTGTPKVSVSGTHAADFTVTVQPASPVAAAGFTTFDVTFDPGAGGTRSATLTMANDDSNENPYNFSISGTGALPEINVTGNSTNISDGDITPRTADATDFGSTSVTGGTVVGTFTIQNTGAAALNLTGTPRVAVSGTNAADFSVIVQPGSPVAAAGSATVTVNFDPGAGGVRNATLSIANDDSNEDPYDFSIRGTGTVGEINLTGNGVSIADGDNTPGAADFTDFGSTTGTVVRTFTIQNTGTGNLGLPGAPAVIVGGTHAADFTVTAQPAPLIAAAGSTTFQVTFDPSSAGLRTATLSIANDDSNENPYDFAIRGTGLNLAPTDIALSAASLAENNAANATVGTLSGADPDPGQSATLTFTLVSGAGSTDNASFAIAGDELKLTPGADYETQNSYSVRVRATDAGTPGLTYDEVFVITVTDVNEVPTDIALSAASIAENNAANAPVGLLSGTDPDAGHSAALSFAFTAGAGDADNADFTIAGNELRLTPGADFETQSSYSIRVIATDAGTTGLTREEVFVITVTNANEAPTDSALSAVSIEENNAANATVGSLSATDPDAGDTHTFTLVSGAGDTDNASFTIAGDELKLTPGADFEIQNSYSMRVRATDAGGLSFEEQFIVTITDANEVPTAIALSVASLEENSAPNATVGTLTATDPDAGATHTFTLAAGAGDTDNASFTIAGNELKLTSGADFETQPGYSVRVRATDAGGLFFEGQFTITITDANDAPTAIALSAAGIAENSAPNATIGTLSATDADAGDTHTFTLVAGTGDADNASFAVTGNELSLTPSADFETQSSYSIRVIATDAGTPGLTREEVFVITVTNANESPAAIGLSTVGIAENNVANATIGTLSATDPDAGETHTFSLAGGAGDTDNASFSIAGNELRLTPGADFETQSSYSVRVRATDAGTPGLTDDEVFVIAVTDANEVPTAIILNVASLEENNAPNATVGILTATDPDASDTHTFMLATGPGDTDNANFTIAGNDLKLTPGADFETRNSYSVRVRATDAGGLFFEEQFILAVTDANEAPTVISLSADSIAENNEFEAIIGSLGAADADAGDMHTFTLVAGTGDADNASFVIAGNELKCAAIADFETQFSYSILIRVTDSAGLFIERPFLISITNVKEAPTALSPAALSLPENSAANSLIENLFASDPDAGDTHTFTLVTGAGDTDNARFTIAGNELMITPVADFETQSSYSIRLRATDTGGLFFERITTITVLDVNEAPADIALSAATIAEGNAGDAIVGLLSATDPDAGERHDFTLVAGTGDTDNASFVVFDNALRLAPVADFESQASYTVRVRATDSGGLFSEKQFTITVTDVFENMSPVFSGYLFRARKDIPLTVPAATILARVADTDGGTPAVSAVAASGTMGGAVSLAGNEVIYTPPAGFTGLDTFAVTIVDGQGGSVEGAVTVFIGTGDPLEANTAQMAIQPDGHVALLFQVVPGQPSVIQRSTDLDVWTPLQTVTADADGLLAFLDTSPQMRYFYQAVAR